MLTSRWDKFVKVKIFKCFKENPFKPYKDFSNQTCSLLDMEYDSYGWTALNNLLLYLYYPIITHFC